MRDFKVFLTGTGLSVLMMAVGGCNSSESIQNSQEAGPTLGAKSTQDSSEFDRELIAAKNGNAIPARQEQAMMAILDKYGVAYPKAHTLSFTQATEAVEGLPTSGSAAAKSAAASFSALRRDITSSWDIQTFSHFRKVNPNSSLGIAVLGNTDNVDPFLVAYLKEGSSSAETIKVIGYSDDIGSANRNSVISWTNNTNAVQTVWYAAFAYSTATGGFATIVANSNGTGTTFGNARIGGLKQFGGNPLPAAPSNCFPSATRLSLQVLSGGFSDAYALVVDTQAMKGGLLHVNSAAPTQLHELPWIVHNPYPSFVLLFRNTTGAANDPSSWRFIQRDIYSCVN
jgi:hypothetical protein